MNVIADIAAFEVIGAILRMDVDASGNIRLIIVKWLLYGAAQWRNQTQNANQSAPETFFDGKPLRSA